MSDEEIAEYALELRELKVNSKPIITSLTMLAGEIGGSNRAAADAIAGVVEKRIRTSEPKLKLTALYVLDSIAKNIGGHYVARFAAKLPETFLAAHVVADEPTRKSMARLFHTWRPIFAQATLAQIEAGLPPNALAFAAKLGAPPARRRRRSASAAPSRREFRRVTAPARVETSAAAAKRRFVSRVDRPRRWGRFRAVIVHRRRQGALAAGAGRRVHPRRAACAPRSPRPRRPPVDPRGSPSRTHPGVETHRRW